MKVQYISQPFPPEKEHLGNQLKSLLTGAEGKFEKFTGIIAFVKLSGVSRVYSALQTFKDAGGRSLVSIGIDHGGTSKQGLEYLRKAVDQVLIYYDNSLDQRTFHPKLYLFEAASSAIVILGSGNLTAGGLFTNYESHIRLELNLDDSEDRIFYDDLLKKCEPYFNQSSGCVRPLTDQLFAELRPLLPDESAANKKVQAGNQTEDEATLTETSPEDKARSKLLTQLFGSSKFSRAPTPDISFPRATQETNVDSGVSGGKAAEPATKNAKPTRAASATPVPAGTPRTRPLRRFWKTLSANDVSTTSSPGQIVIPIIFRSFFEPLPQTKKADAGGKGRQWDATFPVEFVDENGKRSVTARCILYEPETGHARQNTECRFTFRDRDILTSLSAGDILEFRQTGLVRPRFVVEKIAASHHRNGTLRASGKFGWL